LPLKYTQEVLEERRRFVKKFFSPTPEYAAFCRWHLEVTAHLQNRHLHQINTGSALRMTSNQPLLEMAVHRHAAIDQFVCYRKYKDLQAI